MRSLDVNIIKRTSLLISFVLGLQLIAYSQNAELRIIDLSVTSKAQDNLYTKNEISQKDTLIVSFKMNKAELASKLIVHIGNKKGKRNILDTEYPVVKQANKYYVDLGRNRYQINGYTTQFEIPVNKSKLKDFFYITIYAEDHSGQLTSELRYKL